MPKQWWIDAGWMEDYNEIISNIMINSSLISLKNIRRLKESTSNSLLQVKNDNS